MTIRNTRRSLTAAATAGALLFATVAPAVAADVDSRLQARLSGLAAAKGGLPAREVPAAVVPVKSYGPSFPALSEDPGPDGGMSESTKQSVGCAIGGTSGTVLAAWAGGENLVNVIAGGLVAPANAVVLYTGLVGVVFASFCAIGQALTPLYLHLTEPPAPPPRAVGRPVRKDSNLRPRVWTDASYMVEAR